MEQGLLRDLLEGKRYPTDLLIVILFTIMAVVGVIVLPDGNIVRIVLGIPILLFLPGYALVSVLWPERYIKSETKKESSESEKDEDSLEAEEKKGSSRNKGIDTLERIALSFGLSIAIVSIIGLALNFIWKITLVPILVSMLGFILIAGGFAWYRRTKLPEEERFFVSFAVELKPALGEWTQVDKAFAVFLAISLIVSGSVLAYIVITPTDGDKFTELYILDQNHTLENLPTNLTVNETGSFIIGIVCHEHEMTNYRVIISLLNMTGERQNRTLLMYNRTLEHGEDSNETIYFQIDESGEYRLKFELYKEGEETLYIFCHFGIRVE